MSRSTKPVPVGKIQATHGIRGQLRVIPFSGEVDSFLGQRSIMIKSPSGALETFAVSSVASHGKRVLIKLEAFDNINQVLFLVGREVYLERVQLPVLPEGEYYWSDLIGLSVFTGDGVLLGELSDIIATGSNDVYVVKGEGEELLLPALEDVVLEVDLDNGKMVVSPPEGLSDL